MNDLGTLLVIVGIVLVIAASAMKGSGRLTSFLGAVMWKTGGFGGLGHLPGDFTVKKGHGTFYFAASAVESRGRLTSFPIVTCLLASVVPGLLAWLLRR